MVMASIFVSCVAAFSKPRQRGSQERYQSTWPPCEMSSRSRRLQDCCRHPSFLWMSASLTGQLGYMAADSTRTLSTLFFIPLFIFSTAPLSGTRDDRQTIVTLCICFTLTTEKSRCIHVCWGEHQVRVFYLWRGMPWVFFFTVTQTRLVQHASQHGAETRTAEHNSFTHK